MKRLILALLIATASLQAGHSECLEAAVEEMNAVHYTCGDCCDDPIFEAVSTSMLGWGLGLFIGIALLTGFVHNSHAHTTSSSDVTVN